MRAHDRGLDGEHEERTVTREPRAPAPRGKGDLTVVPAILTPDEKALLMSWLHGRSPHSTRAYQANVARFFTG